MRKETNWLEPWTGPPSVRVRPYWIDPATLRPGERMERMERMQATRSKHSGWGDVGEEAPPDTAVRKRGKRRMSGVEIQAEAMRVVARRIL